MRFVNPNIASCFVFLALSFMTSCGSKSATSGSGALNTNAESQGFSSFDVGTITFKEKRDNKPIERVCTILGFNRKAVGNSGQFLGMTSYHCLGDPGKAFICGGATVKWLGGGTSTCQLAIAGKGETDGDIALLGLDKPPEVLQKYDFPTSPPKVGDRIAILSPNGKFVSKKEDLSHCVIKEVLANPARIIHNCANGVSSGLSGAAVFTFGNDGPKKLIGIHVNHSSENILSATLWPVNFLKDYFRGEQISVSNARAQNQKTGDCRKLLHEYLAAKPSKESPEARVVESPLSKEYFNAAMAYLRNNKEAFSEFLDGVDFLLENSCREIGTTEDRVAGAGLLKKGKR